MSHVNDEYTNYRGWDFFFKEKKNPNSNTIENTIHYLTSKNSLTLLHFFLILLKSSPAAARICYEDEQKQKDKKEQLKS